MDIFDDFAGYSNTCIELPWNGLMINNIISNGRKQRWQYRVRLSFVKMSFVKYNFEINSFTYQNYIVLDM